MHHNCYTVEYCPGQVRRDMRGTRSPRAVSRSYYRVREFDPWGRLRSASSMSLTSNEGETKEDFLNRVKKSSEFQDWTYIEC